MKLRQLMVSSLPRIRAKKKKQPSFQVLNNETQLYDRNCNSFSPEMSPDMSAKSDIDIVKNVCSRSILENSNSNGNNSTTTMAPLSNSNSIGSGGCSSHKTENHCPALDSIDAVNFNVNIKGSPADNKCVCCDKRISQVMATSSSSSSQDAESTDNDENSSTSGCSSASSNDHNNKHNIPKTRSRIRTNPWLQSPRPTPSTSPTYSSSSSSLTSHSPLVSPHVTKGRYSHPSASSEFRRLHENKGCRIRSDRKWTRKFVLTNLNAAIGGGGNGRPRGYYLSDSDEQSPMGDKNGSITEEEDDGYFDHRISFEYEETLENLLEGDFQQLRNESYLSIQDLLTDDSRRDKRRSTYSEFSCCQDDSGDESVVADVVICNDLEGGSLVSSTLSSELTDIRETDTGYSSLAFDSPSSDLDKAFENISEQGDGSRGSNGSSTSISGSISSSSMPLRRVEQRNRDLTDDYNNKTEDDESDIRSDLAEENERELMELFREDLTDDEVVATLDESTIRVLQSTDCCSDDDELLALEESEKVSSRATSTENQCAEPTAMNKSNSMNKVVVDDDGCVTGAVPRRSLNEIRCSLEEKVNKLRQEKQLVEQKIREAKEAEKIRVQEKRKLQKHVIMHRKQMLLQTLTSLKERLENQSSRLQSSYNAVLSMQKRFAQRQSPLLLISASSS
ncbi:serine-rich adhesin for platelets [Argonauta hians]